MTKISVIVPCFNAEEYICRSIDSVINQSIGFENIELILYDDCSTDSTRNIILDYADKFSNIVPILSDKNSGYPGKGRNEGLKIASSDYIMFLDSDDEYDGKICEILLKEITKEKADLVSCSYYNDDSLSRKEGYHLYYCNNNEVEINGKFIFNSGFQINSGGIIWTCIYKKSIISDNEIKFLERGLCEDEYFLIQYYYYANKTIYLKDYFGITRHVQDDSASSSYTLDEIRIAQNHINDLFVNIKHEDLIFSQIFGHRVFQVLSEIYRSKDVFKYDSNELLGLLKDLNIFEKEINFNEDLPFIAHVANSLVIKEHYKLAILYLKFLNKLYTSDYMRKIHRALLD